MVGKDMVDKGLAGSLWCKSITSDVVPPPRPPMTDSAPIMSVFRSGSSRAGHRGRDRAQFSVANRRNAAGAK
jgi:hypothetical protein